MSVTSVYLDSNIFISPLVYEGSRKAANSKRILGMVERGEVVGYTSTLTWDEIVWVVRKLLGKADSVQVGEKFSVFPNLRFVPVSEEIIRDAQRLVAEYGSDSRDSIHVASALSRKVEALVSDDPDIDAVAAIKRLSSDSFRP